MFNIKIIFFYTYFYTVVCSIILLLLYFHLNAYQLFVNQYCSQQIGKSTNSLLQLRL